LGQLLLDKLWQQAQGQYDLLGTSFAMETAVNRFWLNGGYVPLRLGQQKDEVTGSVAVMMFKAVSSAGEQMLDNAQQQFMQAWPFLLLTQLKTLSAELVLSLLPELVGGESECEPHLLKQVFSFAHQQRSLESSQHALWRWFSTAAANVSISKLTETQQQLLVMLVLQQREMAEVCSVLKLSGRAQAISLLRQAVSECLAASSLETR
jgi:tRNA(Met) cytidine acetyltransferase